MTVSLEHLIGVVSPSRLDTAQRCMAQFYFRYVEKLPERWRSSLSFGKAFDATGNEVYEHKLKTDETPSSRDVQERFAAAWEFEADAIDVWDEGASKGKLLDVGVRAAAEWRENVAFFFRPTHVQQRLEQQIQDGDSTYTLLGIVDVRGINTDADDTLVVADTKTAGKQYAADAFYKRSQPAAYTLLTGDTCFEFHVVLTTKTPQTQIIRNHVSQAEQQAWLRRAGMQRRAIAHAYRSGDWLPNRAHMLCTKRHCEFWQQCERTFGGTVAP